MTPIEAFLAALSGAVARNVVELIQQRGLPRAERVSFWDDWVYWIQFFVLPPLAGCISIFVNQSMKNLNPLDAIIIGYAFEKTMDELSKVAKTNKKD